MDARQHRLGGNGAGSSYDVWWGNCKQRRLSGDSISIVVVERPSQLSHAAGGGHRVSFRGAANPPIDVKALGEEVGYVNVPAYSGVDQAAAKAFATKAHEQLSATVGQAGCGWIVDLRENGGGNMWPMLAGLKPFLGDEPLGMFVSWETSSPPWKAGQLGGVDPPTSLRALEQAWVAVLTGPRTSSSGEAVTIAFKGRPDFQAPTARSHCRPARSFN